MAKKRRQHPLYTATYEAWCHVRATREGRSKTLEEIRRLSELVVHGRGRREKREAAIKLKALLAVEREAAGRGPGGFFTVDASKKKIRETKLEEKKDEVH